MTATLVKTRVGRTVVADGDGRYKIIQLAPGAYSLKVSLTGFAVEEKTDLATVAAQNVQLDFTLKPATVTAEAVIGSAAEAPPVDTTRTVVGGTVATREFESQPVNSRSPLDLIFTLGGVSEEPLSTRDLAQDRTSSRSTPEEAGIFSLSGGTAYSNNITIDGLDNKDFAGKVKTVIIWKLDRLSRNLRDGVNVLADWAEKVLKIVVVTQQLELNGVIGRTIAALLLGLAEIEHGNIRERQKAGIEAAKARGVDTGRAAGSTKANPGRAPELTRKGLSMDEIATALGVSKRTVTRYLAA